MTTGLLEKYRWTDGFDTVRQLQHGNDGRINNSVAEPCAPLSLVL
jgi:hypothetical protein